VLLEFEFGFELVDHFGAEDVLDHVGVAVDVGGGDIGVLDEIKFPEAVVPGDAGCLAEAGLGEAQFTGRLTLEVVLAAGLTDEAREFSFGPNAVVAESLEGDGEIFKRMAFLLGLHDFVDGAEDVLSADLSFQLALSEIAGEDAAGGAEDHGDEEDDSCGDDDNRSSGEVFKKGGEGGAQPAGEAADEGGEPEHFSEIVGPKARGRGWGDEEGDDKDEANGLETNDGDSGHESHEDDVEEGGWVALGGGEGVIEAKKSEFFENDEADDDGEKEGDTNNDEVAHDHRSGFAINE